MKILIFEESVYKIPDKEMDKLNSMIAKETKNDSEDLANIEDIADYIESKLQTYKFVGLVDFSYRR